MNKNNNNTNKVSNRNNTLGTPSDQYGHHQNDVSFTKAKKKKEKKLGRSNEAQKPKMLILEATERIADSAKVAVDFRYKIRGPRT